MINNNKFYIKLYKKQKIYPMKKKMVMKKNYGKLYRTGILKSQRNQIK